MIWSEIWNVICKQHAHNASINSELHGQQILVDFKIYLSTTSTLKTQQVKILVKNSSMSNNQIMQNTVDMEHACLIHQWTDNCKSNEVLYILNWLINDLDLKNTYKIKLCVKTKSILLGNQAITGCWLSRFSTSVICIGNIS